MSVRTLATAALLVAALAAGAHAAAPPFAPIDVFALQWADNPVLSPDGRKLVYERQFFDTMKDVRRSNLWLVDSATGAAQPLTTGSVSDGQAAWSPDATRIAYVSSDEGKAQIFVRWLSSGATARITQLERGPSNLAWSPDGRQLAYTAFVPSEGKPLATLPAAPKGAEWAPPVTLIEHTVYRADGAGYLDPGFTHVFVVDADGGAPRQLTRGEFNVFGAPAWSSDGASLYLSANKDADGDFEPLESELYRVALATGDLTRLTTRVGPDQSPRLSPDGKRLAYLGFDDHGLSYANTRLYVLELASGKARGLSEALDAGINSAEWIDDRSIAIAYDRRGATHVAKVALANGRSTTLAEDLSGTGIGRPYTGGAMSASGGRIAYTQGTPLRPADVAVIGSDGKPKRLTDLGHGLLDQRTLGRVEEINFPSSFDQRQIQGWVVYPPDFDAARRYPLLLEIHGGPFAAYGPHFAPETQLYAAQGYVVLYLNPRGSTSYGAEFANLIHQNYPSEDYNDLMDGVDAVIARGSIDKDNLFVTGGSGGGLLTAWIVGKTTRFRAAVVAKPVINWFSHALTADGYNYYWRYWHKGLPWEQPDYYFKHSPISLVGNVVTPTMVIVGDADMRTPIAESEQYYQALRLKRVPSAMVRIPGASHNIGRRPSQMLAQVLNTAAWFERYRKRVAAEQGTP
ncbi:MAG: S9 family peptidase [Rhodanobacteraceae bacterium]|nr:S9 family peptidase [Rhodanobacteraceae bacterium]